MVSTSGPEPMAAIDQVEVSDSIPEHSVELRSLKYNYPGGKSVLSDVSLQLAAGSRCLLCGANAAGKTTMMHMIAGKAMASGDSVRVLGQSPFHTTELTVDGDLSYLGSTWRRSMTGGAVPLAGDIAAGKMIYGIPGIDPERRERLIKLLDIDCTWSMMEVSDGQRRRVQICLGLLKPFKVLLCDEITVDLDVVGRLDLLDFFREECETRGATIIYATHIFDGMEQWLTHMVYVENGTVVRAGTKEETLPDVVSTGKQKLLHTMERWLREERTKRRERMALEAQKPKPLVNAAVPFGLERSSKHLAFYR